MKRLIQLIIVLCCISSFAQGQGFYGYQTPNKHSFFFSLTWDGETKLGFGYIDRLFGTAFRQNNSNGAFTDFHLELRFPVKSMYKCEKLEAITGLYGPNKLTRRPFLGLGAHFILNYEKGVRTEYQLQLTAVPSYTYRAPLNAKPYATVGAIFHYIPKLVKTAGAESLSFEHNIQGGLHTDVVLRRTLGLGLNVLVVDFDLNGNEDPLSFFPRIDGYWSQSYLLNRKR